LSFSIVGHIYS